MGGKSKGFTLIELIMVIVVLAILAVVAIPRFTDLSGRANTSAEQGVLGGVRAGIATYHAAQNPPVYPPALDSATNVSCSKTNACFVNVLSQGGVTSGWAKTSPFVYKGPTGASYTYTPAVGSFQ